MNIKILSELIPFIDELVNSGRYASRPDYVCETIRNDMRERGKLVSGA